MRRLLAIAAGLAGLACWGQAASGVALVEDDVLRRNGTTAPLFSFASPTQFQGYAAYAGLPASDGCYAAASVTGTKGEALTFTRATTRFCPTDGTANEATGVMCTSGQVCISTLNGMRGISIFRAGTNVALRSEEFDNAAWTKEGSTTPASIGANDTTGPDGAATADRVVLAATGVGAYSDIFQSFTVGSGAATTCSVWVKGRLGTSGTTDLCFYDGAAWSCSDVAFTSAWLRFSKSTAAGTGTARYCKFGNSTSINGGTTRSANDVDVVGFQGEASPYATPYIATTSAAATRNAETALFTTTAPSQPASLAATFTGSVVAPGAGGREYVMARTGASDYFAGRSATATPTTLTCAANTATQTTTTIASGSRVACYSSSTGIAACLNGTCTAVTGSPAVSANGTAVYLGYDPDNANWQADGLISNVCLDSTTTRCR